MAKITKSKSGVWCDYCKMLWGTERRTKKIPESDAVEIVPRDSAWTITSFVKGRVIERHYCFACAKEVQTRHDGTLWTLADQIKYKEGKQELDV